MIWQLMVMLLAAASGGSNTNVRDISYVAAKGLLPLEDIVQRLDEGLGSTSLVNCGRTCFSHTQCDGYFMTGLELQESGQLKGSCQYASGHVDHEWGPATDRVYNNTALLAPDTTDTVYYHQQPGCGGCVCGGPQRHCYRIPLYIAGGVTVTAANSSCVDWGGYLTEMETQQEYYFVRRLLYHEAAHTNRPWNYFSLYYIGGYRVNDTGLLRYTWSRTGDEISYPINWNLMDGWPLGSSAEPDQGPNEIYLMLGHRHYNGFRDWEWFDSIGNWGNGYVCERDYLYAG